MSARPATHPGLTHADQLALVKLCGVDCPDLLVRFLVEGTPFAQAAAVVAARRHGLAHSGVESERYARDVRALCTSIGLPELAPDFVNHPLPLDELREVVGTVRLRWALTSAHPEGFFIAGERRPGGRCLSSEGLTWTK